MTLRTPSPRRRRAAGLALVLALGLAVGVGVGGAPARADYTASNLPDWAVGPFTRAAQNALLRPQGTGWESSDVFNPGVVLRNGTYQLLYRGQNAAGRSQTGYATSTDGTTFTRYSGNPVIAGTLPNETGGSTSGTTSRHASARSPRASRSPESTSGTTSRAAAAATTATWTTSP